MRASSSSGQFDAAISAAVRKLWGFEGLRPLQHEAIMAGLTGRDSLVVMPTGGGKSLCYQVPPLVAGRTDIVVSPLISLMKDQVDGLLASGYPAAALHSGLDEASRRDVTRKLLAGEYRLLFVAPERLLAPSFLDLISRLKVRAFTIDEAHCISHWGHDFRPDYRQLALLRDRWPEASIHAFTATATPRVRQDILTQLRLKEPLVLVGDSDRPNLTYRLVPRNDDVKQVLEAVQRHAGEAVIVYCLSRKDSESLAQSLRERGVKAAAYHAGLNAELRRRTQEAFAREEIDVVVATVAFGMGIDRSNVRCVVHAAMPKSIEHYLQETGRAGRDGLEAECLLLFSPQDSRRWEFLIRKSLEETGQPHELGEAQIALLQEIERFCRSRQCRHRALAAYFGQRYEKASCDACDVCLDESVPLAGGDDIAHHVLSCVKALKVSYGVTYLVDVLRGSRTEAIRTRRHGDLPEYGVLRPLSKQAVRDIVDQLIGQGLLLRTLGELPVVRLTAAGARVLTNGEAVALRAVGVVASGSQAGDDWAGVDRGLFEHLRILRRSIAEEQAVPAFVIFGDVTLRDLARIRPSTLTAFVRARGVGERKVADFGQRFIRAIVAYSREHHLDTDVRSQPSKVGRPPPARSFDARGTEARNTAFRLFDQGRSLADVSTMTGRAPSTVVGYLEDYIGERRPDSVSPWVSKETYDAVMAASRRVGGSLLRPVYEALEGTASYEEIRIVLRHTGVR